jgi:hypothetical protein
MRKINLIIFAHNFYNYKNLFTFTSSNKNTYTNEHLRSNQKFKFTLQNGRGHNAPVRHARPQRQPDNEP